jgi:hypothetical protein
VSGGMHDMPEEGYGNEVEMYVVLFECLWGLYAGVGVDSGEGFEGLLGEDTGVKWVVFWWGWVGVSHCT